MIINRVLSLDAAYDPAQVQRSASSSIAAAVGQQEVRAGTSIVVHPRLTHPVAEDLLAEPDDQR
jgi:hypothetical protein